MLLVDSRHDLDSPEGATPQWRLPERPPERRTTVYGLLERNKQRLLELGWRANTPAPADWET